MIRKKLLLVVFSADLGSISLENCLVRLFQSRTDLKIHHFTGVQRQSVLAGNVNKKLNFLLRFLCWPAMWFAIIKARLEGRKILFQYLSPALFSYPLLSPYDCFVTTDWTRKLYGKETDTLPSAGLALKLHKKTLRKVGAVMGMSQAVRETFKSDYLVPEAKLKKVKMPFKVSEITPGDHRVAKDGIIRILFVGGDWFRKGGDKLLDWARRQLPNNATLTLVTNALIDDLPPRVTQVKNVKEGDATHRKIFMSHDILVLPTLREGLPLVLGEAGAYGLVILVTKMASGAPEVVKQSVNGFICESQSELLDKLQELLKTPEKIQKMKEASRKLMLENFGEDIVFQEYASILFGSIKCSSNQL